MTREEETRAIGLLETLGAAVAEQRGEQRVAHQAINERLHSLDANVDAIREAQQAQGTRIATLPCERHARRISEMLRRLGASEDTGRMTLIEQQTTHKVLRMIGRIAVGVFAAAGAVATATAAVWGMLR